MYNIQIVHGVFDDDTVYTTLHILHNDTVLYTPGLMRVVPVDLLIALTNRPCEYIPV